MVIFECFGKLYLLDNFRLRNPKSKNPYNQTKICIKR